MSTLFTALMGLWLATEILLGLRRRAGEVGDRGADRGSERAIWVVISASFMLAGGSQALSLWRLPGGQPLHLALGIAGIVLGLALRWTSIHTLGRFFTTNVAVREDHRIIDRGAYRLLRHPSYSGLLVVAAGSGVGFGNWLSLALCTVPMALVLAHRIRIEEEALEEEFGGRYREYRRHTWRLVPWIY